MKNYVLETLDEFASRRSNELQETFNAGYETALIEILEMIEEEASLGYVYESIGEYLYENMPMQQPQRKKMGFLKTVAAGAAAVGGGMLAKDLSQKYQVGKNMNQRSGNQGGFFSNIQQGNARKTWIMNRPDHPLIDNNSTANKKKTWNTIVNKSVLSNADNTMANTMATRAQN